MHSHFTQTDVGVSHAYANTSANQPTGRAYSHIHTLRHCFIFGLNHSRSPSVLASRSTSNEDSLSRFVIITVYEK